MARPVRKSRVKQVPLSEVKDDLSRTFWRPRNGRSCPATPAARAELTAILRTIVRDIETTASSTGSEPDAASNR
jgi:hypothetical protein